MNKILANAIGGATGLAMLAGVHFGVAPLVNKHYSEAVNVNGEARWVSKMGKMTIVSDTNPVQGLNGANEILYDENSDGIVDSKYFRPFISSSPYSSRYTKPTKEDQAEF